MTLERRSRGTQPQDLADLTYVRLRIDRRATPYSQLPYEGEDWYAKPITAFMLDTGMATTTSCTH